MLTVAAISLLQRSPNFWVEIVVPWIKKCHADLDKELHFEDPLPQAPIPKTTALNRFDWKAYASMAVADGHILRGAKVKIRNPKGPIQHGTIFQALMRALRRLFVLVIPPFCA